MLPVFNTLDFDVHAWHGQTGGGTEGSQVQEQGEADVLVELLAAGQNTPQAESDAGGPGWSETWQSTLPSFSAWD